LTEITDIILYTVVAVRISCHIKFVFELTKHKKHGFKP